MCSLYKCFEDVSLKYPLEPALRWRTESESCTITYKELAHECLNIKNILRECENSSEYVGICIQQSLALPAVILGILQSGLAFVCLEYEDSSHVSHLANRLNICWVFCENTLEKCLKDSRYHWKVHKTLTVTGIDLTLWKKAANISSVQNDNAYKSNPRRGEMAYAIQTSGTTGAAKVVKVPQSCILPNIRELRDILQVAPGDLVFLTSPSTFDPSVVEMFLALSVGATLLIVPNYIKSSPSILLEILFSSKGITILEATPSFVLRWSLEEIQTILLAETSTLRALVLGGEPCPPLSQLSRWKAKHNKTDLYNIYGVTEVSCWATVYHISFDANEFRENDEVPLGKPLQGTMLQVLDKNGIEIADGEGELFIGGVERSCLIDDETAESLSYPVYRETGDIVKVESASKSMFFLRRKNNTLKRFGSRVSLNKVEQIAVKHDAVEQACCLWEESTKKFCLVIKPKKNAVINQNFLRRLRCYLHKCLEPPSVPDEIICLQYLPLTKHGKIHYQELKDLILKKILKQREDLKSMKEPCKVFSELWSYYLNLSECPKSNETFIHSGGNSVIALQLATEFEQVTHSAVPRLIGLLLQGATFEECCKALIAEISSSCAPIVKIVKQNINDIDVGKEKQSKIAEQVLPLKKQKLENCDKINNDVEANNSLSAKGCGQKQESDVRFSCCHGKIHHLEVNKRALLQGNWQIKVKWKFKLGKCVDASPHFIDHKRIGGIIIIGSHSHKLAVLKSETGELIAMSDLNDRIESSACISHCGEYAFLGSYDGNIYCIELNTGKTVWKHQTGDMVKSSPVLCRSIKAIVIGSYDHSLYCIQIEDGRILWSLKIGTAGIYSSPCISASAAAVFVADLQGVCVAVTEKTGNILWKYKLESPVFSSPALIHNEEAVIFAEVSGLVHCFKAKSGVKVWTFKVNGNIFSSFCTQEFWRSGHRLEVIVFGCHDKHLYCLESSFAESRASLRWKCSVDSHIFATPFLFSCGMQTETEHLFTLVTVASTKGTVYIVDIETGTVKCTHSLPGEIFSSPAVFKNHIFIGCRDDYVYALHLN